MLSTGSLPLWVLAGPTGAGKTATALSIAERCPIEIVSVDSALVYRGLDIGAAKPSAQLRARVRHHLIDICEPTESYSAGRFVTDALAAIADIHARDRIPLLVGGTMLYFRALLNGLAPLPAASRELRTSIDRRAAQAGWPSLHAELERLDPAAAARIRPHDRQRIQRALEVCLSTGTPISELQRRTQSAVSGLELKYWVLAPRERSVLHERIARRFDAMMAAGFLAEVRHLRARGDLTANHPSMRAVGYRQLWAHLEGEFGLAEAVQRSVAATRQLAKRQLTWLRAEPQARWIDAETGTSRLEREVQAALGELGL